MSLYSKIIGNRKPGGIKIRIWYLLNDIWAVQNGLVEWVEVADNHNLETEELEQLKKFYTGVSNFHASVNDPDLRSVLEFRTAWQLLMRLEQNKITGKEVESFLKLE